MYTRFLQLRLQLAHFSPRSCGPVAWSPRGAAVLAILLIAAALAHAAEPPVDLPSDLECAPLPMITPPLVFPTGELLRYKVTATDDRLLRGIELEVGTLTAKVLPFQQGTLPIQLKTSTNPVYHVKVRSLRFEGFSYLDPQTLHPVRYTEDSLENLVRRHADVEFRAEDQKMSVRYYKDEVLSLYEYPYVRDGLDMIGALYLLRQLPLREGAVVCFDAYAQEDLWRVSGIVTSRKELSLPQGRFGAWRLVAKAIQVKKPSKHRWIDVWFSEEPHRIPLVVAATIERGTITAKLTGVTRPATPGGSSKGSAPGGRAPSYKSIVFKGSTDKERGARAVPLGIQTNPSNARPSAAAGARGEALAARGLTVLEAFSVPLEGSVSRERPAVKDDVPARDGATASAPPVPPVTPPEQTSVVAPPSPGPHEGRPGGARVLPLRSERAALSAPEGERGEDEPPPPLHEQRARARNTLLVLLLVLGFAGLLRYRFFMSPRASAGR